MFIKFYKTKFILIKTNFINQLRYCQQIKCAIDIKLNQNLNKQNNLNDQNYLNKDQILELNQQFNKDNQLDQQFNKDNQLDQQFIKDNQLNQQFNKDNKNLINQNQLQNDNKLIDKKIDKKILRKERKIQRKLEKNELKDDIRVNRYRKAYGLDDNVSNEDAKKILDNFFNNLKPGIRYFEKTGTPVYGANFNTPLWYRTNTSQKKSPQYKFIEAELFEKNIIYDFSYDQFMNQKEKNSLIYQLLISLGLNNKSRRPFPLLFANVDKNSYCYHKLNEFYFSSNKRCSTVKLTDKSYLDLLPKDEIIYLSPHAEESLTEFKPNYHYVIGCFIDISFSKNLSFKKSQAEGIKSYKLPIDEFVSYSKQRNKLLPLPIVHQILLDKKMNYDWKFALECNLGDSRIDLGDDLDEVNEFKKKYKNFKKHLY